MDQASRARDLVPRDLDDVAKLAVLADIDARIGEHERPIRARNTIGLVSTDFLHRSAVDSEFVAQLPLGKRQRGVAR